MNTRTLRLSRMSSLADAFLSSLPGDRSELVDECLELGIVGPGNRFRFLGECDEQISIRSNVVGEGVDVVVVGGIQLGVLVEEPPQVIDVVAVRSRPFREHGARRHLPPFPRGRETLRGSPPFAGTSR
ncbi:MAG: hypothetical protein M5U31_16205 [Acidimicrobiia bacterium]|nr:hypothetical protein [Acidimicrobiia bacterium]